MKAKGCTWLRPLRAKGLDPAVGAQVSREIEGLAATEQDAAMAKRLKALAVKVSKQRVPVPEGFPAEVHALLLARANEIDALIESGSALPGPTGRTRIDF